MDRIENITSLPYRYYNKYLIWLNNMSLTVNDEIPEAELVNFAKAIKC